MIPAFDYNGIDVILFKGQNVVLTSLSVFPMGSVDPSVETEFPSIEPQPFVYINICNFKSDVFINIFSGEISASKRVKVIRLLGRPQTRVIQAKSSAFPSRQNRRSKLLHTRRKTAFSGR